MIIEGKFTLKAPIQKLWDTLLDPETLRSCIPGAEKIERLDDKTGEDIGKAGRFTQKTVVDLKEKGGGDVEIAYRCNASIVGKLAMFGDRILQARAKKLEAEFTSALREKLQSAASHSS